MRSFRVAMQNTVLRVLLLACCAAGEDLVLGFMYTQTNATWQVECFSQFKLAMQDVNSDPTILPNTTLGYLVRDNGANEMQALRNAMDLVAHGVVGLVGTGYSSALPFPAGHASVMEVPIVSPGSTAVHLSDKARFPYLLRAVPSDASDIKAMVAVTWDLGWREVAAVVQADYQTGLTGVLRPALESLGIGYLALVVQNPVDEERMLKLEQVIAVIASSGYRITLVYTFPDMLDELNIVTRAANLRTVQHSWILVNAGAEESFLQEWGETPDSNMVVLPKPSDSPNLALEELIARWPHVSVRYNISVHGPFNKTTRDPFWGASTYTPIVWDMDYADVGDHLPDYWGTLCYDTLMLYARAIHALELSGVDPMADRAALRDEMLGQRFHGVSGYLSFDQDTQDREKDLHIILLRSAVERPVLANITEKLGQEALSSAGWCSSGCTSLGETGLGGIPWPSGRMPSDGRGLAQEHSRFYSPFAAQEEMALIVTVHVRNSFQRTPCASSCQEARRLSSGATLLESYIPPDDCETCLFGLVNYSAIHLSFWEEAVGTTREPAVPAIRTVDYGSGILQFELPRGLEGHGLMDRVVTLNVMYEGEPLADGDRQIRLLSQSCAAGSRVDGDHCVSCLPGTFSDARGSTGCTDCLPGTVQEAAGATGCVACSAGFFAPEPGMSTCDQCPAGGFQSQPGQSSCTPCNTVLPGGSTTNVIGATSAEQCICEEDYYYSKKSREASPRCESCPAGLICPRGVGQPLQDEGYHAGVPEFNGADPPFVVACANKNNCPGGTNLSTCPAHREGLACDACEVNYYEGGDGKCAHCDGASITVPLLIMTAGGLCFVALMFFLSTRQLSVSSQNVVTMGITGSLVFNAVQSLTAFSELSLTWQEPMSTLRTFLDVFALKMSYVNPGCTFQTNNAVTTYVGSLSVCPLALAALFACFGLSIRMGRTITWPQVCNSIGLGMMVFYLSLAMATLVPLQCTPNPDGTSSVVSERAILCWQGEHWAMVGFSIMAIMVYIVPFFALSVYLTAVYPARIVHDGANFVRRTEFLFKRFKSSYYFYGLIFVSRSLIIAMLPVIFSAWAELQIMAMMLVIIVALCASCRFLPWKTRLANVLDIFIALCLVAILTAGTVLTNFNLDRADRIVQGIMLISLALMGVCVGFVAFFSIRNFLWPPKNYGVFLSHHKGSSQVLARWFKLCLREMTPEKVFLDSDNLEDLSTLLQIVGFETKNLVVLLTRQTLTRLWCACEVVTAYKSQVNIVLVSCDGTEAPTDDMIEEYVEMWSPAQQGELTALGVSMDHMREAYRSLRNLPILRLEMTYGQGVGEAIIQEVVDHCRSLSHHLHLKDIANFKSVHHIGHPGAHHHRHHRQYLPHRRPDSPATPADELAVAVPPEAAEEAASAAEGGGAQGAAAAAGHGGVASWAVTPHRHHDGERADSEAEAEVLIAGNLNDPEAACCCQVVKRMLMQTTQLATVVIGEHEKCNLHEQLVKAKIVVALLSRGALSNPAFAKAIVAAHATKGHISMIPMVADVGFQFPDAQFWGQFRQGKVIDPEDPGLAGTSLEDVEEAYHALFQVIALKFTEYGSEQIQQAEISAVKRRINSKLDVK